MTSFSLQSIKVVFTKEVIDNLRDKRSIVSTLFSSLIGPGLLVLFIIVIGKTIIQKVRETELSLPVIGAEHAPSLIAFLEQYNVNVQAGPENPEEEVRNGNLAVVMVIPEEYPDDFRNGRPATVRLVVDSTRQSAIAEIERVRNLILMYESQISSLRLLARGISPQIIQPIAQEIIDVATPQSQVVVFLNMMPYFIILVVFVGGMYVIIDSTAGERERGSLEPLLANPVKRSEFVLGKILASIPFAVFSILITLMAFYAAFNLVPLENYIGIQLTIEIWSMIGIFFISLPMVVLASGLQMIIASFTRSFKEAQTYTAFLPLVPALPGVVLAFLPIRPGIVHMLIPTFGQQLLINQLMRGEPVDLVHVLVSTLATLLLAFACIGISIVLYQQERLVISSK